MVSNRTIRANSGRVGVHDLEFAQMEDTTDATNRRISSHNVPYSDGPSPEHNRATATEPKEYEKHTFPKARASENEP
jgi:hypothetical protein